MSAGSRAIAEFEFGDEWDWADFLTEVQTLMRGHEYWRIDGWNIDWRGRNGSKIVAETTAKGLLRQIYGEDIYRLTDEGDGCFKINAPTHDTPMGSLYTFQPITQDVFERQWT